MRCSVVSTLAASVAIAVSLGGCGSGSVSTTTPSNVPSTSASPSPGTSPGPSPSPSPAPGPSPSPPAPPSPAPASTTHFPTPEPTDKTDVYVVLRMDDISYGSVQEEQASVINWAIDNNVKFNFGVIASSWPLDCATNPGNEQCNDIAVRALNDAYNNGYVRRKGGNNASQIIEISDHSYGHEEWSNQWADFETPKATFEDWQTTDMVQSMQALAQAFPEASIRTFIAPTCRATGGTLDAMHAVGLDIVSGQAQLECNSAQDPGEAPHYNYDYAPCEHYDAGGTLQADCVPPGDVYSTTEGFQPVRDNIFSAPGTAANSNLNVVENGLSVADTLGVDQCGCNGDESCPIISSAIETAAKSNGLHWTVVMMHPQTVFPGGQTYLEWLQEFKTAVDGLEKYAVHFINFQDLVTLTSPQATEVAAVTV